MAKKITSREKDYSQELGVYEMNQNGLREVNNPWFYSWRFFKVVIFNLYNIHYS